jgi:hypothetical protein
VNTNEKKVFDYTTKTKRDSVLKQMNELTSLTNIKAIDFFDKSDKEIYVKGTLTIKQEDGVVDIKSTTQDKKNNSITSVSQKKKKNKNTETKTALNNSDDIINTVPVIITPTKKFKSPPLPISATPVVSMSSGNRNDNLQLKIAARSSSAIIYRFISGGAFDVITFDVTSTDSGESIWTHSTSAWEDCFLLDTTDTISVSLQKGNDFLHLFRKVQHRGTEGGENAVKTHTTKNGKIIQKWILYRLIDNEMTDDDIKQSLLQWVDFVEEPKVREMYHAYATERNAHSAFAQSINKSNGGYWNTLKACATYAKITQKSFLSQVFMDKDIFNIVNQIDNTENVEENTWSDELKLFARGVI